VQAFADRFEKGQRGAVPSVLLGFTSAIAKRNRSGFGALAVRQTVYEWGNEKSAGRSPSCKLRSKPLEQLPMKSELSRHSGQRDSPQPSF
jgi:hypothetical protein